MLKIRPQRSIENVNLTRKFPFFHDFGHFWPLLCSKKVVTEKSVKQVVLLQSQAQKN